MSHSLCIVGADEDGGWVECRTAKGYSYFYNTATGESQWVAPEGFKGTSHDLKRDEIQSIVTKVTADYDRWTLLESNEPLIIQLQARWRGILVRKTFQARLKHFRDNDQAIVKIQANWKGFQQRTAYRERLEYMKTQMAVIIKVGTIMQ